FLGKAKRAEAYLNLRSLYFSQKAFWAEHGTYTNCLCGPQSLGWNPEGSLNYTYGFAGSAGKHHVIGQLKTPASTLHQAFFNEQEFKIAAAGKIYRDKIDILTIDHTGKIVIEQDGLT
ncbi:MAG TPA: hypothetical protein VHA52_10605, partial [Candidatus Babeliaceae bacterium]|nr:hypothetical protein [Candidatus Babeliaceae bacterium]